MTEASTPTRRRSSASVARPLFVLHSESPCSLPLRRIACSVSRRATAANRANIASQVRVEFDADAGPRQYRHVVVDECQDFSPEMLRAAVAAAGADGSVTFFGDYAQQIYGQRFSWRSVGLSIPAVPSSSSTTTETRQRSRASRSRCRAWIISATNPTS